MDPRREVAEQAKARLASLYDMNARQVSRFARALRAAPLEDLLAAGPVPYRLCAAKEAEDALDAALEALREAK